MKDIYEKLVEKGKISMAIDKALTAPFPQIAIHHLIDEVIEICDPSRDKESGDNSPYPTIDFRVN